MSNLEKTLEVESSQDRRIAVQSKVKRFHRFAVPCQFEVPAGTSSFPHYIFSPVHYESSYAYPLVVWLHGSGCDESQLFRIMPKLSLRNYIAVAPRGLSAEETNGNRPLRKVRRGANLCQIASMYDWPETPDAITLAEHRIFEAIARTTERYTVHKERIFVVGFDVGGTMALRLATKYPDHFAGAVSLCGSFPETDFPLRNWSRVRDFPLMMVVGAQSKVFPPQKVCSQLRLFHAAGLSISLRQYHTAQELTPKMLSDVNRWIMEQIIK